MSQPKDKTGALGTLASFVPIIGDALSGLIQRGQSRADIRRQNEYNDPASQLQRLRDAGLPMAAMGNNIANTQSALPQTNQKGLSGLQNYATNQINQKQLALLTEEIRLKKTEADKNEAETEWFLKNPNDLTVNSNLTRSLSSRVNLEEATSRGANIANRIQSTTAENLQTRFNIENTKGLAEIGKIISDTGLVNAHLKGVNYDNKIKEIVSKYQEGMSNGQLLKLGQEIKLLKSNITGRNIENDIAKIKHTIANATKESEIYGTDMENALKGLTYDRVSAEFKNYNQYMEFVQMVQDEINKTPWEKIKDPIGTLRAMAAFAYTSITGLSGSSNILSHIK